MEYYENKSLKRCYNIVTEYGGFDEFLKRIEESINETYTKEQCYKDILENAGFNETAIIAFIKHIMLSGNKGDINLIINNLNIIYYDLLSDIIEELNKDERTRQLLISEVKMGLIAKQDALRKNIFYEFLKSLENGNKIIQENFQDFISGGCDFQLINKILEETGISKGKIIENRTNILNNSKGENLLLFVKWLEQRGIFNIDEIELENFVKALHSNIEDKTTLEMLQIIYKELMDKQKLDIKDIELLGRGAYSSSYKIGKFVLKIGRLRYTDRIPYHRRILQPIIRQDITCDYKQELYIEIQNEVDDKWYVGLDNKQVEEELYKIYKEMREAGIVWTDVQKDNVGRLIRPNKTNYYIETLEGNIEDKETLRVTNVELNVNDNSVGIFGRKKEENLRPGELVILDTDYIFKEENIDIKEDLKSEIPLLYIKFEKKYIQEKEQKQR